MKNQFESTAHEKMEAGAVKKQFPGKFKKFQKEEKAEKAGMKKMSSAKMKGGKC